MQNYTASKELHFCNSSQDIAGLLFHGLLAAVSTATAKTSTFFNEGPALVLRKDGKAYEDVKTIIFNFYQQNQKIEKANAEFRAVAMKTMEKTDKVMAKLESIINKQDSEMKIMKQLRTKKDTNGTILEQVLQKKRNVWLTFNLQSKLLNMLKGQLTLS